jgi:hypothetical protein
MIISRSSAGNEGCTSLATRLETLFLTSQVGSLELQDELESCLPLFLFGVKFGFPDADLSLCLLTPAEFMSGVRLDEDLSPG